MSKLQQHGHNDGCCNDDASLCKDNGDDNPSGQSVISHRPRVYQEYLDSMQSNLSEHAVLRRLTTRKLSDPTMALIEAWGSTLEVLSFYQDRIANEHYLNTASERLSVLNMAEQIGYKPKPGVSAYTYLSFICDEFEGSPETVTIAKGTMAQSVPGQDEMPQIFETDMEIVARPEWNAILPLTSEDYVPSGGDTVLYLDGALSTLKAGDVILIVGDDRYDDDKSSLWDHGRITEIEAVEAFGSFSAYTRISLHKALVNDYDGKNPRVFTFQKRANIFGYNASPWESLPVNLRIGEYSPLDESKQTFITGLYADRQDSWVDKNFSSGYTYIHLDQVYDGVAPEDWVLIANPSVQNLFQISSVHETTQTDFLLSAQVTKLSLSGYGLEGFSPKSGLVLCNPFELSFGAKPIEKEISGQEIVLDEPYDNLYPEQIIAISGQNYEGVDMADVLVIDQVMENEGTTVIKTKTALSQNYLPQSVTINANVTTATHGQSTQEIIGSGDGAVSSQSFNLMQLPLSHVSAATAQGYKTTLEIRVDDVLWSEVKSFYGLGSEERVYTITIDDNGRISVQFGDGINGARLTSGINNIVAYYRVGTGISGIVDAGKISQLLTMPIGCSKVTNPVASEGGDDPETLDTARQNAPLSVVTMDRIVSLKDFEDFTRAYPSIGKAQAVTLWDNESRVVHVTVSLSGGVSLEDWSITKENLRTSIDAARHVDHVFNLSGYTSLNFSCKAELIIHSDYLYDTVEAEAQAALESEFSFDNRTFGQDINLADVYACIQNVKGVQGVDINALHFSGNPETLENRLLCDVARNESGVFKEGELLTINMDHLEITERKS